MIAVIDYGAGNLRNVCKAFEHIGADDVLTDDATVLHRADKVVLPGVGAFADCLNGLKARGLFEPTQDLARAGKPLLGICVGMQLLFDVGEEMGEWRGLELLHGRIVRFDFSSTSSRIAADAHNLKIPHIGWNRVEPCEPSHPLFKGIERGGYAYFVHSYYPVVDDPTHMLAATEYGYQFASVVGCDNIWGIQFHPEKSQDIGLTMLANFAFA